MTEMLKQAQVHVKTKAVMKKKIRLNNDIEKGTAQKLELSEEFFEGNGEEDADEKSSSKSFVDENEEGEQKKIDISIDTNDAKLIMCQKHYIQKQGMKIVKQDHRTMFKRLFKVLPQQMPFGRVQ